MYDFPCRLLNQGSRLGLGGGLLDQKGRKRLGKVIGSATDNQLCPFLKPQLNVLHIVGVQQTQGKK